jgi:hypothetical protein
MPRGALGISISEAGIGSVLNSKSLKVPLNQRSYAWEESHVKTLLQDFSGAISNDSKTYFLGTIVLTAGDDEKLEVADGQQRLATTAILISAIRDHLCNGSQNEKSAAEKYTQNFLLEFDERSDEHLPKLSLNSVDNNFFVKNVLLAPDHPDRGTGKIISESHKRIDDAINICANHVKQIIAPFRQADQSKMLYDWIDFLRGPAVIIKIEVPDSFNAYTLFETLNDRGLRASQADILKNYLFGKSQDRLSEIAPKWDSMCSILESVDDDLTLTYLRHYWISLNGPTIEKELANRIREKITGRQQAVDICNALAASANDYTALFSPLEHAGLTRYDKETRAYIYIITRILQIIQIRPLLLAVIRSFTPAEAKRAFKDFLSWSVRFLIAGGAGGGVIERYYGLCAKEITDGEVRTAAQLKDKMREIIRPDMEFEEAARRHRVSKGHLARYYLRAIELYRQGTDRHPELGGCIEDTTQYTLEHVIPLNPCEAWNLPDDIIIGFSKRLGNMTLLDPSENVELGNKAFNEKREIFKTSPLLITREIDSFSEWGPDQIDARQAMFAKDALKIWPL